MKILLYFVFSGRSVRMTLEPDIYDIIEADNTAMERVHKSKAREIANSTPTHSSNTSMIGRGLSRGILKRGKTRRQGGDSIHAGFSDVKSVSRCVSSCVSNLFGQSYQPNSTGCIYDTQKSNTTCAALKYTVVVLSPFWGHSVGDLRRDERFGVLD